MDETLRADGPRSVGPAALWWSSPEAFTLPIQMSDPTVVLVSVGTDSATLIDEIEKKGLRVVSVPFTEAEESIEREKPLLVVLHGARGATELSTLLEDADDPPQVAVVAPRADLGTLMGLNRDIVVSLLATELTEKTVAARIEAVIRQRAKARGISLNLAARRLSLGPRPSLSQRPSEPPPESLVLHAPTPDVALTPVAGTPAVGARSEVDSGDYPRPPRTPSRTAIGLPAIGQAPPHAERTAADPGPPPRPPARPPLVAQSLPEAIFDSVAPDDIESIHPSSIESLEPTAEEEPTRPAVPRAAAVPTFEPSELLSDVGLNHSIGPELRAALPLSPDVARPPISDLPPPASAAEEFGEIGGEEDELALPLRPQASPDSDSEDAVESDADADEFSSTMLTEVTIPAIPGSAIAEALAEARARSDPNHPIPEPPPLPLDADDDLDEERVTERPTAVDHPSAAAALEGDAFAQDSPRNTPAAGATTQVSPGEAVPGQKAAPQDPFASEAKVPEAAAERARLSSAPRVQPAPSALRAVAVVLGLAAVSSVAWYANKTDGPRVEAEKPKLSAAPQDVAPLAPDEPASTSDQAPAPSDAPAPADAVTASPRTATDDAAAPVEAAPSTPEAVDSAPAEPAAAARSAEPATTSGAAAAAPEAAGARGRAAEPAILLENPFLVPDAGLPGCDRLTPGVEPRTADPVAEASTHWSAARKAIVKGDIEGASRAMCSAVAINPQSPAVEGLARLYTLAYSAQEAMIWVERAIALQPNNREFLLLRGDVKSQQGQQEAATQDWLAAKGISPGETKRRASQATEYVYQAREEKSVSNLPKAEQLFRRALGFEETNLNALVGMAEVLLARKLYDQAGTFAVRATQVFEPVPEAYLVLGDVAWAKADTARARASFERALAIRPDFWPAKTRLRGLSK